MANVAGTSITYRDMCLEKGCMEKLIQIERSSTSASIIKNTVYSISNLLHGQPLPGDKIIASALPILHEHISDVYSEETLTEAVWGLCYISGIIS